MNATCHIVYCQIIVALLLVSGQLKPDCYVITFGNKKNVSKCDGFVLVNSQRNECQL